MNLTVTLKPHIGFKPVLDPVSRQAILDDDGKPLTVEVNHKQCLVFAQGKQVAIYCGQTNEPGRYLSFIAPYPDEFQQAVAAKVTELVGGAPSKVGAPPPEEHDAVAGEE